MTDEEYDAFVARSVRDYARGQVRAGSWDEADAERLAQEKFDALVPEGILTDGHFFCTIRDAATDERVGHLWFAVERRENRPIAYVYEISIEESQRRRGFARAALRALEEKARMRGLVAIGLHVFGDNEVARTLYRSLGFVETDVWMAKPVAVREPA